MALYKGKTTRVEVPAAVISEKFADLSVHKDFVDRIPEAERERIGNLRFEHDALVIVNPSIGEMKFTIVERTPEKIVFNADGMIPLSIFIDLVAVSDTTTDITSTIDIEIPAMLRPIIGGKLQQVADMFGEMIAKLAAAGQ